MMEMDFLVKYKLSVRPKKQRPPGTPERDHYMIRVYDYPPEWEGLRKEEISRRLLQTRLRLRKLGEEDGSMLIFSFWPDVIMIKEVGDPLAVGEYLGFDQPNLKARVIMAQGRQNTNYAIDIYACHPFFIQGISTMTNGENTAFVPIREFLLSRGDPGYIGYRSDSEVFTHILHYTLNHLGLSLEAYKHILTPLKNEELADHPDGVLISNGPGDPAVLDYLIKTARELVAQKLPVFGICLGHQIMGLALGGRTYKLKFGHHGCNHPVMDMESGKIEVSSQNHGFCVDIAHLPELKITHKNLNDQTLEGFAHRTKPLIAIQFHPEAAPGPHDSAYFFRRFRDLVRQATGK